MRSKWLGSTKAPMEGSPGSAGFHYHGGATGDFNLYKIAIYSMDMSMASGRVLSTSTRGGYSESPRRRYLEPVTGTVPTAAAPVAWYSYNGYDYCFSSAADLCISDMATEPGISLNLPAGSRWETAAPGTMYPFCGGFVLASVFSLPLRPPAIPGNRCMPFITWVQWGDRRYPAHGCVGLTGP